MVNLFSSSTTQSYLGCKERKFCHLLSKFWQKKARFVNEFWNSNKNPRSLIQKNLAWTRHLRSDKGTFHNTCISSQTSKACICKFNGRICLYSVLADISFPYFFEKYLKVLSRRSQNEQNITIDSVAEPAPAFAYVTWKNHINYGLINWY